jgi:ubiquinone/menaquinone biosynthesis C-methylase UbiE
VSWYEDHVLPRIVDLTCGGKRMHPVRRPALEGLAGTVVELGFGSGPNVGLYPGDVERVLAVEPSEGARALARKRMATAVHPPVDFVGLDGARLPLGDDSADAVLSTFTLCTIPDVEAAMHEVARVLRPGGGLHFVEHGRSEDPKVYRRQVRFEPIQRRIAGGCHLTRDPAELAEAAGLRVERLARFTIRGPKILTTMSSGRAVKH